MTCEEMHSKLAPYADSELPAPELSDCESHLRGCASCAADALSALQLKRQVRSACVAYSPTPEFRLRMEQHIRAKRRPQWFAFRIPVLATAAVAAMLVIASVAWTTHLERERAFTELADLHVATLASSNPVDVVSTDRHTVKPWFAGKLPFSFNLPELQNTGFTLEGGKVAYFEHTSGAQLLFSLRKHQLSAFVFKEQAGSNPFRLGTQSSTELGLHSETWSEGGLRYFVVGDAPAGDVHELSELLKTAARP